jgi:hypothetical protein
MIKLILKMVDLLFYTVNFVIIDDQYGRMDYWESGCGLKKSLYLWS